MFKFLHAADIHLDSPLRGLERYEAAPVDEIRQASRRAFEKLVQLALDESVAFVLIAGDLYDGPWKNFHTGLYFVKQMYKLRDANIPVFLIAGNHDAANKMTKSLPLPDNVTMLSTQKPETCCLDDFHVAIHGQGFATEAVTADLAAAYPAARAGYFNIGMLHTCATGRDGHERYAPCTIEGLRSKQYDYWALGHVHNFEPLSVEPYIVFPGNIQGRHIREAGPKGCMLVTVDGGRDATVERRFLDVFRWEKCEIDASDAEHAADVPDRAADAFRALLQQHPEMPLAVRVEVAGDCPAHEKLAAEPQRWTNEIRSAALDAGGGAIWVEKVKLQTSLPLDRRAAQLTDGPIGELMRYIEELRGGDDARLEGLKGELAQLKKKLPAEMTQGPDAIDLDSPEVLRAALGSVEQMLVTRLLSAGRPA
jgi:DNA repair exonuclease SbcCD nuclease subunit